MIINHRQDMSGKFEKVTFQSQNHVMFFQGKIEFFWLAKTGTKEACGKDDDGISMYKSTTIVFTENTAQLSCGLLIVSFIL